MNHIELKMSTVDLVRLEHMVDRVLFSSITTETGNKIEAVKALVMSTCNQMRVCKNPGVCDKIKYNFIPIQMIFHPIMSSKGYTHIIHYSNNQGDWNVFLKFQAMSDWVKITFSLDGRDPVAARVPFERNDTQQIDALKDFFRSSFEFHKGCKYPLMQTEP